MKQETALAKKGLLGVGGGAVSVMRLGAHDGGGEGGGRAGGGETDRWGSLTGVCVCVF